MVEEMGRDPVKFSFGLATGIKFLQQKICSVSDIGSNHDKVPDVFSNDF